MDGWIETDRKRQLGTELKSHSEVDQEQYFLSQIEIVKDVTKEILRPNLIETR